MNTRIVTGIAITTLIAAIVFAPASGYPAAPGTNGRRPQVNYMLECQGCHLPDGAGMPGRVPALKGEVSQFLAVPGGRAFLVQVPGSANSKLSDGDLADVLNLIVAQFGGQKAGTFAMFTADEVARYRTTKLADVQGTRARLVAAFPRSK
ncbi:mono/diheme cytochrome c family protein [Novosphingobium sp. 1529]|uniref:c-type cytochrome n=1 Tax=Novosphingobium sp. 1529 TaxID=3156424 RepID=UPI003398049F